MLHRLLLVCHFFNYRFWRYHIRRFWLGVFINGLLIVWINLVGWYNWFNCCLVKRKKRKTEKKVYVKKERGTSRRCFGMKWKVTEFKNKAQTYLDSFNFSFNKNAKEAEMLRTLITTAGLIWSILQTFLMLQKKIGGIYRLFKIYR